MDELLSQIDIRMLHCEDRKAVESSFEIEIPPPKSLELLSSSSLQETKHLLQRN